MSVLRPTTDGLIVIRPPSPGDAALLVAGRDEVLERFLEPGDGDPRPAGCIVAEDVVVGWVDYDSDRAWLDPGEVNVGYNVFAAHRGKGYASRAVQLLMHHLAVDTHHQVASLLIHPDNERSLVLAARNRFTACGDLDGNPYFKRPVPPLAYTDGVVSIRALTASDLDADLEARDDQQIDWLWLPGQRERWEAMTPTQQRAHALAGLEANAGAFATGPKWRFAADALDAEYVAYVDCDLANEHVPLGDANIAYSSHPSHRGRGHVSRAVRLVLRFLADHTGAREAHLVIDEANAASRRVATAVGATPTERWVDDSRRMVRFRRPV